MAGRLIAIGDIHGCLKAFDTILNAIAPTQEDILVPLGDYIDRGPDSKGVIQRLIELESVCHLHPILGNHEEMLLRVLYQRAKPSSWLQFGGDATLDSYGFSGDLAVINRPHRDFLKRCLDYFETDTHFFTHGNYDAYSPLTEQTPRYLRWIKLSESIPDPHCSGKPAIVGHTPNKEGRIFDLGYLKCIDTYCYGGKWLTALEANTGQIWQADNEGRLQKS